MKRFKASAVFLAMVCMLCACAGGGSDDPVVSGTGNTKTEQESGSKKKLPGSLVRFSYSPGYGDMTGEHHREEIYLDEQDGLVYVVTDREYHSAPEVKTIYAFDEDGIQKLEDLIAEYDLCALEKRRDRDLFVTDYSPWSFSFTFEKKSGKRTYVSFGEHKKYKDADYEHMNAFMETARGLRGEIIRTEQEGAEPDPPQTDAATVRVLTREQAAAEFGAGADTDIYELEDPSDTGTDTIVFAFDGPVRMFRFFSMTITDIAEDGTLAYTYRQRLSLEPDGTTPVAVTAPFYGSMPNNGFCYFDETTFELRWYAITQSGYDGSYELTELDPASGTEEAGDIGGKDPEEPSNDMNLCASLYDEVLEETYSILAGGYDPEREYRYLSTGLMEKVMAVSGDEALLTTGYAIADISGDGVPELLIGERVLYEGRTETSLFSCHSVKDGKLVPVFEGWARNRKQWLGENRFLAYMSGGAASSGFGIVRYEGEKTDDYLQAHEVKEVWEELYFSEDSVTGVKYYHNNNSTGEWDPQKSEELHESESIWNIYAEWEEACSPFPLQPVYGYMNAKALEAGIATGNGIGVPEIVGTYSLLSYVNRVITGYTFCPDGTWTASVLYYGFLYPHEYSEKVDASALYGTWKEGDTGQNYRIYDADGNHLATAEVNRISEPFSGWEIVFDNGATYLRGEER